MVLKKILVFALLISAVIHLLYWRQFSLKVLPLEASILVTTSKQSAYDLVGICNELKHFFCSNFLLKHLINQFPGDSLALFNLAYLEYQKKHWKLSQAYLVNYLSLKEDNTNAYLLYARVLQNINQNQKALDILYWGFYKTQDFQIIQALVLLLNKNNFSTEALSLLSSISNSSLKSTIKFNTSFINFSNKKSSQNFSQQSFAELQKTSVASFFKNLFKYSDKITDIRVFSFRGENFFIPVRLKEEAKPNLFKLIKKNTHKNKKTAFNQISLSLLEENYFFLEKELKVGEEINFPKLFVGPWVFNNIKFNICKQCQSQVNINNVPNLSYKITKKYNFSFLNIFIEKPVFQ